MKVNLIWRKITALLLVACGMMTFTVPAMATETRDSLREELTVTNLLSHLGKSGNFAEVRVLKDANDENRYCYLPFLSGGYLIYDTKLDIISEYSEYSNNCHIELNDSVYYTGALQYFKKANDSFIEIATGNVVESRESLLLYADGIDAEITRNYAKSRSSFSDTRAAHYISGQVPNYSYNPNGICGSTAAAMLLRWYDIYQNQKYVPSSLESGDGVALIKHLVEYIDEDVPGSMPGDVFTGIIDYCSSQGISHPGGYDVYNDAYVIGRVDSYGTPFLIATYSHPKYHRHWVTGYGYNYSDGTCYIIVNDGWGSTNISINPIYASQIVW